jgi:hypothetical protein
VLARFVRVQAVKSDQGGDGLQSLEVVEMEVGVKPPRGVRRPAKKKLPTSRWAAWFADVRNGSSDTSLPAGFDSMPVPAQLAVAMKLRAEERVRFLGKHTAWHSEALAAIRLTMESARNKSIDAVEVLRKTRKAAVDSAVDANVTLLRAKAQALDGKALHDASELKKELLTAIREVEVHVNACVALRVGTVDSLDEGQQKQLLSSLIESYHANVTALPFCEPEPLALPEATWTLDVIRQSMSGKGVKKEGLFDSEVSIVVTVVVAVTFNLVYQCGRFDWFT